MKKIIFLLLIVILALTQFSCSKKEAKNKYKPDKPVDANYDDIQKAVIKQFTPEGEHYPVFCVYQLFWIKEESFYTRKFVYALIQDFNSDLASNFTYVIPVGLVFDKQKNEYIRVFSYEDELKSSPENMYDIIPKEALDKYLEIANNENKDSFEKMANDVLTQAKKYYNIKDETESEEETD